LAEQWYYAIDGQQRGPISGAALRDMAARGALLPADLVWTEGMSQWAPASATRAVFQMPGPVRADATALRPAEPRLQRPLDHRADDFADLSWIAGLEREPARKPSRATEAVIASVALSLSVVLVVGIAVAVVVPNHSQLTRSYTVNLAFQGQEDSHLVEFKQNERVQITVTTEAWGGPFEPDVDLFIIDPDNNVVAQDILPAKDCEVSFVAEQTGSYRIVVVLDDGNGVRCIVRY
jgi:hypothetical protein